MGVSCLNCLRRFIQLILGLVNICVALIGIAVLGVGAWAQSQGMNFFVIVGNSPATRIPVLLIVVGLFTVLFGVIGIVGAIFATKIGGRIILGLYGFVLLLLIIMEVAGGIAAGVERNAISGSFEKSANETFQRYNDGDSSIRTTWDTSQQILQCCGVLNFTDYKQIFNNNSVPVSCCKDQKNQTCLNTIINDGAQANKTGLIFSEGCVPKLETLLGNNLGVVAGIGIVFGLLQIFGVCLSCFVAVVGPNEEGKYEVV